MTDNGGMDEQFETHYEAWEVLNRNQCGKCKGSGLEFDGVVVVACPRCKGKGTRQPMTSKPES